MKNKFSREHWLSPDVLGFAAHWAWIWCVFWSSRFYNAGAVLEPLEVPGATTLEPLWVLSLFANVVGLAALLLLARVRNPLSELRSLPVEAGVLTAAGTLCVSFFPTVVDASAAATVYALGAVLTGVGSAGVVMLGGERLVEYGPRRLMRCFVGAIFAGAVGYSALTLVPGDISQFAVAALPLAGMGLYVYQGRRRPRVPQQYRNVAVHSRPPVPMMLVALFFGISFGLMKGLIAPVDPSLIAVRDILNIVAIAAAAGTFYVTSVVYKMDFDHLTYQVAMPLVAAGFLLLPLHEPWHIVGTAVYQFGYQYFYIVLWAIWAVLANREKVPAAWMAASSPWGMLSRPVLNCFSASGFAAPIRNRASPPFSHRQSSRSLRKGTRPSVFQAPEDSTASVGWNRASSFCRWPSPSAPAGKEEAYTSPVEMSHRHRPKAAESA